MSEFLHCTHTKTMVPTQSDFKMHTHNYHEILYFISGDADYIIEGNIYKLHRGDLLMIKKSEAHRLQLRSDAPYERIVIHFDTEADDELLSIFNDKPLGKNNLLRGTLAVDNMWEHYLERMCRYNNSRLCKYYLYPLLNELRTDTQIPGDGIPDRAQQVIEYINTHLDRDLSLESLSTRFFISKTHLNRIFKKSTGTTVWNYVTVKRLFYARELISAGEKPTEIYQKAGFYDYTAFYKAYKTQFNESPKAQKVKSNV